ncbi:ankyrin repeat-containing domain protein [Aspergillus egyptiacus]|nr:ankyrin repeat-containing domain protein [Aspergillus egyptiacus]
MAVNTNTQATSPRITRRTRANYSSLFQQAVQTLLKIWTEGPPDDEPKIRDEVEDFLKDSAVTLDFDEHDIGTLLLRSAQNENDPIFRLLTGHNPDVGRLSSPSSNALHWAAVNGHVELLKKLLAEDVTQPDAKDKQGRTALSVAIDSRDKDGATPLWWAVRSGQEKTARVLVARGAAVPRIDDEEMMRGLLFETVVNKSSTILELLLGPGTREEHGRHCKWLFVKNDEGRTLLSIAAETGNLETLRTLMWKYSYSIELDIPDKDGRTAIWWAASRGHDQVLVRLLGFVQRAAAIDSADVNGFTPLSEAVRQWLACPEDTTTHGLSDGGLDRRADVVRQLLHRPLVTTKSIKDDQFSMLLWRSVRGGHRRILYSLALRDNRVKPDSADPDGNGRTLMSWAEETGFRELVGLIHGERPSSWGINDIQWV